MAPFLVFLRTYLENGGLIFGLWPIISVEVLGNIIINSPQALIIYFIAAVVIYLAYFPLKTLFTAAIYNMIMARNNETSGEIGPISEYVKRAITVWAGFVKVAVFGIIVYMLAFFIGLMFGELLGSIWSLLHPLSVMLLLLSASTYLQILKISMVISGKSSLRDSIKSTRSEIGGALGRIIIGNIAVCAAAFILILAPWSLLKWTRSFDWSYFAAAVSIILQQVIIVLICSAQVIRINFNHSVLRKGD